MAEKKRARGIASKVGKYSGKSVKVEFTEVRKQGGGSKPSRMKGGKVRKPAPTIRSRRKHTKIDD